MKIIHPPHRHQSEFTLFCTFPEANKYFGIHTKFTFRGDDHGLKPLEQIHGLQNLYSQLSSKWQVEKAIIFDNRAISEVPNRMVQKWFRNKIDIPFDVSKLNLKNEFEFDEGAKQFFIKVGLMQPEAANKTASLDDNCFFY